MLSRTPLEAAPDIRDLAARFAAALHAVGAVGPSNELFSRLVARYRVPTRAYHGLGHVAACLRTLDRVGAEAESAAEVQLALWFHDAVYAPLGAENEEASARLAEEELRAFEVAPESIGRIAAHVRATASHDAVHGDSALVVDVDLAILGASPLEFDAFEAAIREEYREVPESLFRRGRARVLRRFLGRERIFRSASLHEELEAQAHENLARRIAVLEAEGAAP